MTGLSGSALNPEPETASSVLVVSTNWIGDCIMSLPALQDYHDRHPSTQLHILCRPHLAPLWAMSGMASSVQPFPRGNSALFQLPRQLARLNLDQAFVLPNSIRSALAAKLSGAPVRTGLRGHGRSWLLTTPVDLPAAARKQHQCWEAYYILGLAVPPGGTPLPSPRLTVTSTAAEAADALMTTGGVWTGLIPCAARGPSKEWPKTHFVDLGQRLLDATDQRIVLFGGPGDAVYCEDIRSQLDGRRCLNLAGRTDLPQWAACLARCRDVVANDSGGMHLASALGVPVVAIFGLTDPAKTGPLGTRARVIQESRVADRDISRDSQDARDALAAITVDRVWDELNGARENFGTGEST